MIRRPRRPAAALPLALLLSAGCAHAPSPAPPADDAAVAAVRGAPLDWYALDRALPRPLLLRYNRWFGDLDGEQNRQARLAIGYASARDSLGVRAFLARSLAEQRARRREAAALVHEATIAVTDPARRLRRGPSRAALDGLEAVLARVLTRLHTAVGLDPENTAAWHDLAFFSAVIGDDDMASQARRAYLELSLGVDPADRDRRCRAVLDEAWYLRAHGYHDRCRLWLMGHSRLLDTGGRLRDGLAPRVEHDLLMGLLAAEAGDVLAARRWIQRLPLVPIPEGTRTRDSAYLRTWVHVWSQLHDGNPAAVSHFLSRRRAGPLNTAVGWRFWQDMGRAAEAIGDRALAERMWAQALALRPFLGFHPQAMLRGPAATLGLDDTDAAYVTSYRTHHTAGSLWGFAVTRVLLCQVHGPDQRPRLWREAMAALDRCVRRRTETGHALLLRARLHLQRGDTEDAGADLRQAAVQRLAAGKSGAEVAFLRGVAALNGGDLERAVEPLRRATELGPANVRHWQSLAVCLSYLGRDDEAAAAFDRAVELAPDDGSNRFNRGLFHLQQGRRDLAEQDLLAASRALRDNRRATTLLQAIASGREVTVDTDPGPVRLVASAEEIAQAEHLAALMDPAPDDALAGFDEAPAERSLWLELLRERHARDPQPATRQRLATALLRDGDHDAVRALLAPAWPDDLMARERVLLLSADRALGEAARARSLAAGAGEVLDPALTVTAVTLLRDVGEDADARRLLRRALARWPDEPALRELSLRLP